MGPLTIPGPVSEAELRVNAERKRKLIALVRAAARAPDPMCFIEEVPRLRSAWSQIGNVGAVTADLTWSFENAMADFWDAAAASDRRRARESDVLPEPVFRLKQWLRV